MLHPSKPHLTKPKPFLLSKTYSLSPSLIRYRHTERMALKQPHWKSNPFVLIVGVAQTRFSRSQLAKLGLWGQTIEAAEATKPFFSKRERIPRRFQIAQASKWPGKAMMANLLRLMAACCRLMARDIICVPST